MSEIQTSNLQAHFDTEHEEISELFLQVVSKDEWYHLWRRCDAALLEMSLPRIYRIEYHLIRAWDGRVKEHHVSQAKDLIDALREVYEVDSDELPDGYVDARIRNLTQRLELVASQPTSAPGTPSNLSPSSASGPDGDNDNNEPSMPRQDISSPAPILTPRSVANPEQEANDDTNEPEPEPQTTPRKRRRGREVTPADDLLLTPGSGHRNLRPRE